MCYCKAPNGGADCAKPVKIELGTPYMICAIITTFAFFFGIMCCGCLQYYVENLSTKSKA